MEKSARGIDHGFVELVNGHRTMLERLCRIYEDGIEERKDLFQEIVCQLWRSWPSFRGEASAKTWMYRVALNTAITALRQRKTRPEHVELEEGSVAEEPSSDEKGEAAEREKLEMLYLAMRGLSRIDRAVLAMRLDGFGYAEIARSLGLTETNVGAKLTRARSKLQELLTGRR